MLNSELGLTPTSPHSLPWYPPTCDEEQLAKIKLPAKYANLPGFGTSVTKDKVPDENARPRFLVSFGKVDMTENLAELGARIKTFLYLGNSVLSWNLIKLWNLIKSWKLVSSSEFYQIVEFYPALVVASFDQLSSSGPGPGQVSGNVQTVQGLRSKDLDRG